MATDETRDDGETRDETRVEDDYAVTIPRRVRERLDLEPGDSVEWVLTEDGDLRVEVVEGEYGVFDDAPTVSLGDVPDDTLGLDSR
ncbi:AbrB/MazE/SpoVT family DNA-binding domain-containing protein [Halorussus halophilus]|uniref:AbrB/MazE/SpoVT family DNA-binding domain-containing protein n=1 Tax=Halorussus halophilus TaxID=2650975 RepID=UPI001301334B|nr:AbrB/MazE/SpoVT family DNA-binding domain-containing protein [Halorussus halophilus]